MIDETTAPEAPVRATLFKARETLAKRLADIVCLPASRITPQERNIAADLLIDILRESPVEFRLRCATRIALLPEAPASVLRWLGVDEPKVAEPVISRSEGLKDADLASIARSGAIDHRIMVSNRRELSPLLCEAIIEAGEPDVILALLANPGAMLSDATVDAMVRISRDALSLTKPLSKRTELKPSQGLTLFWWSDPATRKHLLMRFGVERHLLQDAVTDVYALAAAEGWSDSVSRKALQFIERRQRNRAALDRSPFKSLEEAVQSAATKGISRRTVEEMSYLAGVKPATGAKIFTDLGGEPIAVFCKAAALKRPSFDLLWSALKRPRTTEARVDDAYEHVIDVYESLGTGKAQTILRYWNWALTSAMAPALAMAEDAEDAFRDDRMSAAQRASRLIWGAGLGTRRP